MNDHSHPVVDLVEVRKTRSLCVQLVLNAVVSYRSVPRILEVFEQNTQLGLQWVPHFTSVINWTLRYGLGLLQQVSPINEPWIAILDHSIDVGTKKVLVALRVRMDALSNKGRAIQLEDCECIGLKVCESISGESTCQDLQTIFNQAGMPTAILKDGDFTLQKGVRLLSESQGVSIPVIEDIGHVTACVLKHEYEKKTEYQSFTASIKTAGKKLRQTAFAFLMPPKLRDKARFQNISALGKWSDTILDILSEKGQAKEGSALEKIRCVLPDFLALRPFLNEFSKTLAVTSKMMEALKNEGLSHANDERCRNLLQELPENSKVKKGLLNWLEKHCEIQKKFATPLLVSSDIIETLFGNFKHVMERSPKTDMNRTVLLIPALCGIRSESEFNRSLALVSHKKLQAWDEANIPYTIRRKRMLFNSQKLGN